MIELILNTIDKYLWVVTVINLVGAAGYIGNWTCNWGYPITRHEVITILCVGFFLGPISVDVLDKIFFDEEEDEEESESPLHSEVNDTKKI